MIKDLISIANHLDRLKLTKEADLLDKIILKIAAPPMIDVIPLHRYEQLGSMYDDEEDEEAGARSTPERTPREKRILRDERSRGTLKYRMENSHLSAEEEEKSELDAWYNSISSLGDDIILIPFDKSDIDKNHDILWGLNYIFGLNSYSDSYKNLYNKANILFGRYREGELDRLKEVFPHLWEDISKVLEEKGKKEEEVVYMLYNQETSPDRPGFTKDPDYFAHDLGHTNFDSEYGDPEFKDTLIFLINDISELYKDEEGESLRSLIGEYFGESEDIEQIIPYFFSTMSGPEDIWADIFGLAASGKLSMDIVHIPRLIEYHNDYFELPDDKVLEAKDIIQKYILQLNTYINPSKEPGTFAPGPFRDLAGKVILQDI